MKTFKITLFAATLVALSTGASLGQDAMAGHDMPMMGGDTARFGTGQIELPEICRMAGQDAGTMGMEMENPPAMDQAHKDLFAQMDEMNSAMMTGMMAEDIDVAFVCGMIPHHQSAVNMAKAELAHGDDEWAKQLAQQVIDGQQKEIDDMLAWLEERAAEEQAK